MLLPIIHGSELTLAQPQGIMTCHTRFDNCPPQLVCTTLETIYDMAPSIALLHGSFLTCALLVIALGAAIVENPQADQLRACPLQPVTLPLFEATAAATVVQTPAHALSAPQATEPDIEAAANAIVACANSVVQAERYAVFTDRYLADLFLGQEPADQPAFERMIAVGIEPQAGAFTLENISDIERRDDGRVAVTFHIANPEGSVSDRLLLAWDREAEAWLIDEIVTLDRTPEA